MDSPTMHFQLLTLRDSTVTLLVSIDNCGMAADLRVSMNVEDNPPVACSLTVCDVSLLLVLPSLGNSES